MPVILGGKPDHDFDEPLGLLIDCHRRIERFLNLLATVAARRRGAALSDEERQGLRQSLEYFRSAAPRHTQDEEDSLFPRLRETGDSRIEAMLRDVALLEEEHRAAGVLHDRVDALVERWLERGQLDKRRARVLVRLLAELKETYRRHIAFEDEHVFPLTAEVLTTEQVACIGNEMALRRGIARPLHAGGQ